MACAPTIRLCTWSEPSQRSETFSNYGISSNPSASCTLPSAPGKLTRLDVEIHIASSNIKGPSRGSGIELSNTCMRKRRVYARPNITSWCLEVIHAARLYQALVDTPRLFPSWATPKIGSAPANGVDATPRRCPSVNGGDQIRARAFDPAPVYSPVTAGPRELKTLAAYQSW